MHDNAVAIYCWLANGISDPIPFSKLNGLLKDYEELLGLVQELTYDDPCWYDHHGYCQAHSLSDRPCPHDRAKKWRRSETAKTASSSPSP